MKTFFKFIGYSFMAVAGFFIIVFLYFFLKGLMTPETPGSAERQQLRHAIEYCWKDYERKSHDASTKLFIAGACEKLEDDLRKLGGRP
jgi:hypothetical protein